MCSRDEKDTTNWRICGFSFEWYYLCRRSRRVLLRTIYFFLFFVNFHFSYFFLGSNMNIKSENDFKSKCSIWERHTHIHVCQYMTPSNGNKLNIKIIYRFLFFLSLSLCWYNSDFVPIQYQIHPFSFFFHFRFYAKQISFFLYIPCCFKTIILHT